MIAPKVIIRLISKTVSAWLSDNASKYAAALAFYTTFSIAPLLIIAIGIAGIAFGDQAAQGEIVKQLSDLIGSEGAVIIQNIIRNTGKNQQGWVATVVGFTTLIVGASTVFAELQDDLNRIWKVQPKPELGIFSFFRTRLLSFGMILTIGFLLLVSLIISTVLSIISSYISTFAIGFLWVMIILNNMVSFCLIALLFAAIFKYLPDVKINWSDVWIGSLVTTSLFMVGKILIGLYLGHSSIASTFGAAGSFVVVLLWLYYSSQILLLGAEFTKVQAAMRGSSIEPSAFAVRKAA